MKTKINRCFWLIVIILVAIVIGFLSGCMRTDNQREEYHDNGQLKSLHYTSSTSWATDSSSREITIDPNGMVTIKGWEKDEDSVDVVTRYGTLSSSPKEPEYISIDGERVRVRDLMLVDESKGE